MPDDRLLKHLDFIQATIGRLAGNSFTLKTWSAGLASVIIGLTAKDNHAELAWIAAIPTLAFFMLDAYFLSLERRYRELYDHVRKTESTDFSMKTNDITPPLFEESAMRPAVFFAHVPILVVILVVWIWGIAKLATHP